MKKRYLVFILALVLSASAVAGCGAYIKYKIIAPLGLSEYMEKSLLELPFLMFADDYLKFSLEVGQQAATMPSFTLPENTWPTPTTWPTKPSSDPAPTEPSTAPTIPSTGGETTPTVPSTPAVTEPVTQPTTTLPSGNSGEPNFHFPGEPVDDSWYDNVLFIGNSRTCGLRGNARSGNAVYFADYGMTVFNIKDKRCSDKTFSNLSFEEILAARQYDKIFVNFGLNESGYPLNNFYLAYKQVFEQIRAAQPNAKIILMSIMGVTRYKYALGEYYHPNNLAKMNAAIASFANNVDTFYIDPNPFFTDSEGFMYESLTNDGYHLLPEGCIQWRRYISHIVNALGI